MGTERLILIEGMIGAGKTTTARLVETFLTSRGEDARAFQELAEDHPIRTRAVDQLREHYRQLAEPPRPAGDGGVADPGIYAPGQWRRLAERSRLGQQTVILESTFLQNSVMPAFIEGAPPETVREIFTTIEHEAAAAEPLLIYLRHTDIASAIARVHRDRGEAWAAQNMAWVAARPWARSRNLGGREAVIQLYQAWEGVVDDLYGRYSFGKLMVTDPQRDWDTALARIYAAVRP
jgi:hypothetical protein